MNIVSQMSIIIFTDNPNVIETKLVMEQLISKNIKARYLAPWDINLPGLPDLDASVIYVPSNMLHRGSTFELLHRMLILRELEKKAIIVNPVNSILQYSKEHLVLSLAKNNFIFPNTLVTENIEEAYNFAHKRLEQGQEVVLKPVCKARGIGVIKLSEIRSRSDLLQFLLWYNRQHADGVYYLQDYIPNKGYDVRCLVVNGEVVGREKRYNPNDFRYNVAIGGSAEAFTDSIYDELSIKVAEAVGLKITGIDILPGINELPYVLEANCFPGYMALINATNISIHKKIADYLSSLC
jgi:RimK family alpha-L-glutamate ligase